MKTLLIAITENTSMRGVERYAYETAKHLKAICPTIEITMLVGEWQKYYGDLQECGIVIQTAPCGHSKLARHLYLATQVRSLSQHYSVVHYCNTLPYLVPNRAPTVMTIHDVAEYDVPDKYDTIQLAYRKGVQYVAARLADHIVTVSHFSKGRIMRWLGVPSRKITVTYNGVEHFARSVVPSPARAPLFSPSILFFGATDRTKGARATVDAFCRIQKEIPSLTLYIVGEKGSDFASIEDQTVHNPRIQYVGFLPDEQLQERISQASAVIVPSRYEGFGFPALEAFVFNDNIIASNTTALGEISREFAWPIDPCNEEEVVTAMRNALRTPKSFSKEEREKVLERFSWPRAAQALLEQYEICAK